ncbi:MAG TPA: right-handed parallel beta-helix repeat-containing protein [Blastocatellia bacterium]|nr:right-handed parallel beta-helix repeat-containing protein [Blastocatellia bacterium]
MTSMKFILRTVIAASMMLLCFSICNAQATRTWVSGVGDDANPCSRTAPCKTFAGAISKTAPGGEIDVLDPGGFGALTITKSIKIEADGLIAGVLVSGTNGFVISAQPTDVVEIRGLTFNGLGTGIAGIKVNSAGTVHIENCYIYGFTQKGIDFAATNSGAQLFVQDTTVKDNQGANSGGIIVEPTVSGTAVLDNVRLLHNQFGLRVQDNANATATNTTASGNAGAGFIAVSVGAAAVLNLNSCVATGNLVGIKADNNAAALVRIDLCNINNNGSGLVQNLGKISSFGNNFNSDSGTPTLPNIGQQ